MGRRDKALRVKIIASQNIVLHFFFFFKARDIFIKNLIKQSVVGRAVKH